MKHKRYETNEDGSVSTYCGATLTELKTWAHYWTNVTCKECLDRLYKETVTPKGAIIHKVFKGAQGRCGETNPKYTTSLWRDVTCPDCIAGKPTSSYNHLTENAEQNLYEDFKPKLQGTITVKDKQGRSINIKDLTERLREWFE